MTEVLTLAPMESPATWAYLMWAHQSMRVVPFHGRPVRVLSWSLVGGPDHPVTFTLRPC